MNKKGAATKEHDTFKILHNVIKQMVVPTISNRNLNRLGWLVKKNLAFPKR